MRKKAIALLSGGLDSTLAVKLIMDQGFEVIAVNMITPFCNCNSKDRCESKHVADKFGIEIKMFSGGEEYLQVVRHPKHGYGKNMNPCLDCRVLLFKKARRYMEEVGAEFIFSGEVLGQRPMSQHKQAMKMIETEAGLSGRVLRPLSAKLLEPTIPEQEGLIDREKLLGMQGRTRKPQMALANDLGINDYPCPAGGCLLTDAQFALKLKDLFEHNGQTSEREVRMLRIGRHFRLNPKAKAVVGRNEEENKRMLALAGEQDMVFDVLDYPGPSVLLQGDDKQMLTIAQAASLAARYSDGKNCPHLRVRYHRLNDNDSVEVINVPPGSEDFVAQVRI